MRWFVIALMIIVFGCQSEQDKAGTSGQKTNHDPEIDTVKVDTITPVTANDSLTDLAYYYAGLLPEDTTVLNGAFLRPAWKTFNLAINEGWDKARKRRLESLSKWEMDHLRGLINDTLPLFYPFSGPDFLHANYFYPNASDYYFIALEPVVDIPPVYDPAYNPSKFLFSLQHSLRDVLGKSYFITTHMMEDLDEQKAYGVLPIFYAFLARTEHEIIDVYPVEIDSSGTIYRHDSLSYSKNQAVRFEILKDGKHKTLTYFHRSISDRDLASKHPNFKTFLQTGLPKCNSFVKAASYLMHYRGFGIVRDAVLKHSIAVFQDDTGVPIRYVNKDKWTIRLYGDYTRPIKNFTDQMYQTDLNTMYDNTPDSLRYELPFSLGYHIVGDKIQNHQIFIRK